VKSIFISHHDLLELPKDLGVHDSEVIINCLEEYHMVDVNVEWITNSSESINTVLNNVFQELIDLFILILVFHLFNQDFEELYNFRIVVVNTKIEAVEKSHRILL
jgi:hypothetical protein